MNETRAASYSRQLVKEVRIWTEGAPAAPVERKAGLEPAVSMAHIRHGERGMQTNNNRKVWMLCAGRAPRRRSRIGDGEDGLGDARLPDEVGRSYIREQRPKRSIGYIHPTTPLPDAEVSFLTGEVVHQAGMEQRSGFEPPLPAWKAGVLTVEH